ncbi:Pecanex-like protein 1 [Dactylosporangium sp. CA-139066]|uniref:Pecanex-like protein 1 n=1 Tax=Dactylosporangium sp. CA-139066 TaxID=3239930 RepID=UPI003D8CAE45
MQRRFAAPRRWSQEPDDDLQEERPGVFRRLRLVSVGAAVLAFAAGLMITQISDAATSRWPQRGGGSQACPTITQRAPATGGAAGRSQSAKPSASAAAGNEAADPAAGDVAKPGQTAGDVNGGQQNGRQVTNHVGDGQVAGRPTWRRVNPHCPTPPAQPPTGGGTGTAVPSAGSSTGVTLDTLGNDCSQSKLLAHDGFQNAPRCVSTAFGEVSSQDKNPTLLITQAPQRVRVGQTFTIQVSTRNLVRDRFLGAAAGGYYLESAFLTADGLTRGHFHTACRMLASTRVAPDPSVAPAFFVATEDKGGGAQPDVVTINITGMPTAGTAQCAAWAGDGSHRIPMMQKANETPAFDAVRITVTN